jgi:protein SCO1/2
MELVVAQYPQDREVLIFYALALNLTAGTADKTKAAELLLIEFSEEPDHPGIDHYLTYCLGHAAYQPKPFERAPMATATQRILLAAFSLFALCALWGFMTHSADGWLGAASSGGIGGPFVLIASDRTMVTDRSFRGRWMLVYFGYTHCPNVCPTALLMIAEAMDTLGSLAAKVQPLFVTIDPERDTPEVIGEFIRSFDPRILGLTGTADEIAAVAKQYGFFFEKVSGELDNYMIDHGSDVYVIDPDGRYVTRFPPEKQGPELIASRLREILCRFSRAAEKSA